MSDQDVFGMTEGDARELAEEELFRNATRTVGQFIVNEAPAARNMGEIMNRLDDADAETLSIGDLMFAVMYGSEKYVMHAIYELRDRFVLANKAGLEATARGIWENYHAV